MKTAVPGAEAFPQDLQAVQVYNRLQKAFPGEADPAVAVVKAPSVDDPRVAAAIEGLRVRALASGRVHEPVTVDVNAARTVARIELPLDGSGSDAPRMLRSRRCGRSSRRPSARSQASRPA